MFFGNRKQSASNTSKYSHLLGQEGLVIEDIDNHFGTGKIMVGSGWWKATSKSETIPEGCLVKIIGVCGFVLTVRPQIDKQRKER